MTLKLLPCPFCGGDAELIKRKNGNWDIGCDDSMCFGWCCKDIMCGCTDGYSRQEVALERWNKREETS